MFKKILIGTITTILLGALLISVYDWSTGTSSLQLPTIASGSGTGQGNQAGGQGGHQQAGQNGNQTGGQTGQQTGGLSLTPNDWFTVTGQVIGVTPNNLTVQTTARGELALQLGRPGFATQQDVTFNVGDSVTILAFDSPEGLVQAGEIANNNTQQTLYLRDANGRPLWAGQGGGGGGGQGRGQGKN